MHVKREQQDHVGVVATNAGPPDATGSSVLGGTGWNIAGTAIPVLLGILTVPIAIDALGTARFGVLTLAWVVLGYLGLFDFGLGRATTNLLTVAFEARDVQRARTVFWTSCIFNLVLGALGGLLLAALTPYLVRHILNIPPELLAETQWAFYLMAAALPAVTLTTTLRGVLEACSDFRALNVLQLPFTIATAVAPLLVIPFTSDLAFVVGALVATRIGAGAVLIGPSIRRITNAFERPRVKKDVVRPLLTYGGWLTVTNIIGPIMVSADRFVIGAHFSLVQVAYYTTPFEAVSRLNVVSQALARAIFPVFSSGRNSKRIRKIYVLSLKSLLLSLGTITAIVVCFADELLALWVNRAFADASTSVLQILAVGFFINCLAAVPTTLIQGRGRPDLTAKIHAVEFPIYVGALLMVVPMYGILGTAWLWASRAIIDAILLYLVASRILRREREAHFEADFNVIVSVVAAGQFYAYLLASTVSAALLRVGLCAIGLALLALVAWTKGLTEAERTETQARAGNWPGRLRQSREAGSQRKISRMDETR